MSPRSEEFLATARDRLALARTALGAGFKAGATSAAYYAMLYAARAALSEEDQNAKTHSGVWALFRQTYVETGRFDERLFSRAHATQRLREAADYDALMVEHEEAQRVVELADRFVAATAAMIGA
jgi:uncharacterized protein (UPF0332 family)